MDSLSALEFLVSEITVTGTYKVWKEKDSFPRRNEGKAGGTEVSMTVIPAHEDQRGWKPNEATIVSLEVRANIHLMICVDSQKRQVDLPEGADNTLTEYTATIKKLKEDLGSRAEWKEKPLLEEGASV